MRQGPKRSRSPKERAASAIPRVLPPRQTRSRRSLDRMLQAAEKVTARRGIGGLTIAEVVRLARSSNGAFYARFKDKDALLREVQERFLERIEQRAAADFARLDDPALDLIAVSNGIVRGMFAHFREHAPLIRAFIRSAGRDEVLLHRATLTHRRLADMCAGVLQRRFARSRSVSQTAYRLVVATLEQYVSEDENQRWTDWATLATELEHAIAAYLAR